MTVYKAIKPQAESAAQARASTSPTARPADGHQRRPTNNGTTDVPSIILDPVAVTKDNVKDTVVADGFWTPAEICTDAYAEACTAAGIQ